MNKYLRQLMIGSRVPVFLRLGYKDLRKKFRSRHESFQAEIKSWLFPDSPPRVLNGPFKDMPYLDEIIWGSITPRWFGSYERELWDTVEEIKSTPYETIIDIGCAERYYATGLAWRLPETNIYAYDLDPFSREQCARLWKLNNEPGNLHILPWCDYKEYASKHSGKTLCVIDIEGGEMDFLNPEALPELKRSDVMVEVHKTNQDVRANAEELRKRFAATHTIQVIEATAERDAAEYEFPSPIPAKETLKRAFSEGRSNSQFWLWMKQKSDH